MSDSEFGWNDKIQGIRRFSLYKMDAYKKGYEDFHIEGDDRVVSQCKRPCSCGAKLRYVGLRHRANNHYEAFEVCDNCDIAKLF
ncbi:hypothetical protein JCM17380_16340 [Desulfosporosinus burensis]